MAQDKVEAQFANLDDLFAASLDDIADLATFETPPKGSYILSVTTDVKEINKKPAIEAAFTVIETVELDNAADTPSKPGTKFSIAFMLGNPVSEGKLKQFLSPFAAHFGNTNVGQLVRDQIKEVTVAAIMKHRKDKDDPEKVYADLRNVTVA